MTMFASIWGCGMAHLITGPVELRSRAIRGMDGTNDPDTNTVHGLSESQKSIARQEPTWKQSSPGDHGHMNSLFTPGEAIICGRSAEQRCFFQHVQKVEVAVESLVVEF